MKILNRLSAILLAVATFSFGTVGFANAQPISASENISNVSITSPSALTSSIRSLGEGKAITFTGEQNRKFTFTKVGNQLYVDPIHSISKRSSICAWTIAAIIAGLGSVALLATAAALGPGEVVVLAGVEWTAESLGYAAGASGGMSALAAFIDSKFCS